MWVKLSKQTYLEYNKQNKLKAMVKIIGANKKYDILKYKVAKKGETSHNGWKGVKQGNKIYADYKYISKNLPLSEAKSRMKKRLKA